MMCEVIHCWIPRSIFLPSVLRQVVDHFLGSRPRRRPYVQRADDAKRCPHALCCAHPGNLTQTNLIFSSVVVALRTESHWLCGYKRRPCNPQGHGIHGHGETVHIPFPFDEEDLKGGKKLPVHKTARNSVLSTAVCDAVTLKWRVIRPSSVFAKLQLSANQ